MGNITEAKDGMEAVKLCREQDFDVIILDIMMPELDGFSTCQEIHQDQKHSVLIMLSARGEEYDKIHGFELGIDDYVVKPFSPKELMMRVKVVISLATAEEILQARTGMRFSRRRGLSVILPEGL